jgi:MYXO-CTERM domain-containing protein
MALSIRTLIGIAAGALLCGAPPLALAGDVWRDPYPGMRYLHRSTAAPQEIHVLYVDLHNPAYSVRATKPSEKGKRPTAWATAVGAVAAINGDFFDGSFNPTGLAVGDGEVWPGAADTAKWSFVACTAENTCEIDTTGTAVAPDPAWQDVVGGYVVLVDGGQAVQSAADDTACGSFCTVAHPRTAVGLADKGKQLILVMIEGRRDPVFGMALSKLADLMVSLGAEVALNLDGGGSSGMVLDGALVNQRPANEPGERTVGNHLGILYDPSKSLAAELVGQGAQAAGPAAGGTRFSLCPGQLFSFYFTLRNTGGIPWSDDGETGRGRAVRLRHAAGERFGAPAELSIAEASQPAVQSSESVTFTIQGRAPTEEGELRSDWQLVDGDAPFGPVIGLSFAVTASPPTAGERCDTGLTSGCSEGKKVCGEAGLVCEAPAGCAPPDGVRDAGVDGDARQNPDGPVDGGCSCAVPAAGLAPLPLALLLVLFGVLTSRRRSPPL